MKILIFNTLYYPNITGGAEKSVQLLAEGLVKANYTPIIVSSSDQTSVSYVNGVKVYYVKTSNLYWAFHAKREPNHKKYIWHILDAYNPLNNQIEKILKYERPDLVHTNNLAGFSVSVWKLAQKYKIKIIHTLRDYYLLCPSLTMFKNGHNCDRQCRTCQMLSIPKKMLSQNIDAVVGISQYILEKHCKEGYFLDSKKDIIFNSVSTRLSEIKENPTGETVVGFVGTLTPSKGIETLLKGFVKLEQEDVKLYVYGKGAEPNYESYLKKTYSDDRIDFKGFRNAENIYGNIDLLVVPSLWNEPFGRIVPEANSFHVPVLASSKGGLPELIKVGENGYLFDVDNVNELTEKLSTLIKEVKSRTFSFDVEMFSQEKITRQYVELFERVSMVDDKKSLV